MFRINRLRLEIQPNESQPSNEKYGFDISFKSGLNIIAGQNSKGKSTIGSSIYYALGMEELLGAKNEAALGKALKTEFDIMDTKTNELVPHRILYSKVFIEISNERGELATIRRYINSNEKDSNQNDVNTKKAVVYFSSYDDISPEVKSQPLFLRNNNNNSDNYGFYHWLAEFIGFELPEVLNSSAKEGKSVLYLQTIFTAIFIEQTKGWSDFLATIPYFGIPKNKEKVIEFLLNLNELNISSERDRLEKEENRIQSNWDRITAKLEVLTSEYGGRLSSLPENLTADEGNLKLTSLFLKDDTAENSEKSIRALREKYTADLDALRNIPVKKVGDNKDYIRTRLETLYKDQSLFMKRFEEFDLALSLQKSQHDTIQKHLSNINKELASQKGIQNVIDESLLITDVYDKCPTCKQTVSDDLLLEEGVTIEKLSLTQNITYLTGQQRIIKNSITSLNSVIDEKDVMRKYYLRKQRELEEEIKIILQELITDDRDYSDTDTLVRVRLEKKLNELSAIDDRFSHYISLLKEIAVAYKNLLNQKSNLEGSSAVDNRKLNELETMFKSDYLFPFKYSSNKPYNIYIQKNQPFKYYPVFKYSESDDLPQSIKTNSSASDFIRTIWAYSLSLLNKGSNHPGIVLFDEPGQHSVSSESLKVLFEKSAAVKAKQIIIFTSIQKVLIKDGDKDTDTLDLDSLLSNLQVNTDYHIYRLPEIGKSINLLQS
ncbi:hypothetical protein GM921_04000 [Pedobacter sp. LMG 31464]|uniref:Rad50/SbcC-type AAA domain-containing protein n=1 Tax=Pedobacter planticolens TaxID=2679964 RepID=A0A923DY65_9SPHI|nr:hypothetical protein [Pedobacter planticolens]MBB2144633.1 hypothetical protein [Pedobacter planticolens]